MDIVRPNASTVLVVGKYCYPCMSYFTLYLLPLTLTAPFFNVDDETPLHPTQQFTSRTSHYSMEWLVRFLVSSVHRLFGDIPMWLNPDPLLRTLHSDVPTPRIISAPSLSVTSLPVVSTDGVSVEKISYVQTFRDLKVQITNSFCAAAPLRRCAGCTYTL